MRSIEQIKLDFSNALRDDDYEELDRLAVECAELGTPEADAMVHHARGTAFQGRSNFPSALEHFNLASGAYEALGDTASMARVANGLGNVYSSTGNYPEALEQFHRSLASAEQRGDVRGMAIVNSNIGNVNSDTGNFQAALEHNERALGLNEQVGEKSGIATALGNIGNAHAYSLNYPTAMEYYQRAMSLLEELADTEGIARTTMNILAIQTTTGLEAEAMVLLEKLDSMKITKLSNRIGVEWNRAMFQDRIGDHDAATATLQKILALAKEHGVKSQIAKASLALRDLAQQRNDFAAYIEHNDMYTSVKEEINGKASALKIAMQGKQREIDAERKEHEKHMAVLHSTLPKHIADRVARGEVVTDNFDDAAVLFLDVVGFTNNSSLLEADEVVALLQNIFTEFDAICAVHGVTKIKTIGDAYMAVAFPAAGTQGIASTGPHITNLAHAAIEIINSKFTWSHNNSPVQFRIGLHSGPVVAGVLGTELMQYDVWGDTVNVASRMESTSEPGRIHVSDSFQVGATHASPEGKPLVFTSRGSVAIKGKGEMNTFWLSS